jgi:hypothetical protein
MLKSRALLSLILLTTLVFAGCAGVAAGEEAAASLASGVAPGVVGADVMHVPPGVYDLAGPYSRVVVPGNLSILPPVRVDLPSSQDGENIEMAYWLPAGEGPFPVLLFSSPYFFSADGAGEVVGTGALVTGSRPVDNPGGSVQNLIDQFVPHGYAFATHAVRGTSGSSGCNDLMGPKETADIDQAVTWLGTQAWSNGNIGMTGVSYDGSTPWAAASTGNPHLKTIIPVSGVPDMHGLMYRNGSSETRGPLVLNALYYGIGIGSRSLTPTDYAQGIICPEAWEGLVLSGVAGASGYDPTGYWQERNRKPHVLENYEGSVFSVQGLQDWNVDPSQVVPWVDELEANGIKVKQLLGQWGHSWPDSIGSDETDAARQSAYRADHNEILLRWLDSELKGEDVDTGPAAQIRDSLGRWRSEAHYPPHDQEWNTYYLSAGGNLVDENPVEGKRILLPNVFGEESLPQGPVPMESAAISADFYFGQVPEETLVVGLPKVHVNVIPQSAGGYMAAMMYELTPAGEMTMIGRTSMNLLYAAGGTEPVPVVPGMPLDVKMEMQPMDAVIREGSFLVLRLWVFTDGDRLPSLPGGGVELQMGMESMVKLSTVQRPESVYFMPPNADTQPTMSAS